MSVANLFITNCMPAMLYISSVLNNGQLILGVYITMTCLLSAIGASGVCGGDRFTVFTNFTIAEPYEAVDFTVSGVAFCSKTMS